MPIRIVGAKVHGHHPEKRLFYKAKCGQTGPNLTIEVLRRVLLQVSAQGPLPRTLCLFLDNCAGENKNVVVFAFAAYLVQAGIFEAVEVCFLLVGHTHEVWYPRLFWFVIVCSHHPSQDIDQVFSRIAERLRHTSVNHFHDIARVIRESQRDAQAHELDNVFDYKSQLQPHTHRLTGHSRPQHFCFSPEGDCVIMSTKRRCTDNWQRIGELLSEPVTGMDQLARLPRTPLNLKKIAADLKHYTPYLQLADEDALARFYNTWRRDLQRLEEQGQLCGVCSELMAARAAAVVRMGDDKATQTRNRKKRAALDDQLNTHLQDPMHFEHVPMPPARSRRSVDTSSPDVDLEVTTLMPQPPKTRPKIRKRRQPTSKKKRQRTNEVGDATA